MAVAGRGARPHRRCAAPLLRAAVVAVGAGVTCALALVPAFGLAPGCSRGAWSPIRRRATGFSSGKISKNKGVSSEQGDEKSADIVKGDSSSSTELTTQRLKDLRDRTLAVRQKREAELDEYEEGRALIAKYGPTVGMMPDKVAKRTAKRGMVIGGAFYGAMIAVFVFAVIIFKTQDIVIPPTIMAFTSLALLALAVFGSSYGMMSASWEEDNEGSILGTEEFGKNVERIGEGIRRGSMQQEYDKALVARQERRRLLEAKEQKKRELLNK